MSDQTPAAPQATGVGALQLHDARPFFDKVLVHGVRHGMLDAEKLLAIQADGPKGIVQIARYFGSEFLRPELEKARDRMVNLISLHLMDASGGDISKAAVLLRDNSLLSRSKAGSDMLKRLIAMPESSNFGMAGYDDAQTSLLALWSLRSYEDYCAELARRSEIALTIAAAQWFAEQYNLDADELESSGADAEAVIRTALLMQVLAPQALDMGEWPHTASFTRYVTALRKRKTVPTQMSLPAGLPRTLHETVRKHTAAVLADVRKLADPALVLRTLMRPTGAFRARYFLLDDPLAEVDGYHRELEEADDDAETATPASKLWVRTVQGNEDEHSLLTLFLCLAAGVPKKTLLTEKTAASLVRKVRKSGLHPDLAAEFIRLNAPGAYRDDYLALWSSFVQEAHKTLTSDMDYQLHDALALLRRECNVVA